MALRPIRRWPDPVLRQVCAPVTGDVRALAADMLDTMYAAPGRGLAAPQIGVALRLFVMDTTWKSGTPAPRVFVNPVILWRDPALATGPEGCLSLPGVATDVARPVRVRLAWHDLDGAAQDSVLEGFDAVCAQHEYDHLDGILTLDHLSPALRAEAEAALSA